MKDRFGADESPREPAFPRVSMRDAKMRPYHAPRSHLERSTKWPFSKAKTKVPWRPGDYLYRKVAPFVQGPKPVPIIAPPRRHRDDRGVTLEQWNELRKSAASIQDD